MLIFRQNHAARGEQRPYVTPIEDEASARMSLRVPVPNRLANPDNRPSKEWNYTAPILVEVERWLKQNRVPPAKFGKLAVGDPNLVGDLRGGRDPSSKMVARIRTFMAKGGAHD